MKPEPPPVQAAKFRPVAIFLKMGINQLAILIYSQLQKSCRALSGCLDISKP